MIIIDVEIEKAILGRNETPIPGIEYCKGWRDFEGMGIACVCTYDINTGLARVFLKEDLSALVEYLYGKSTAGFNTKRFDLPLLGQHAVYVGDVAVTAGPGSPPTWIHTHYDILEEIWIALGLNPDKFNPKTHGGWGLDAVCQATLGIAKTGHGALAPVWWQQGKRSQVIDYCLNDVWMEAQLLQWIMRHGWVTRNTDGAPILKVRAPRRIDIGEQYSVHQAEAFAAVPDRAGVAAVGNEQPETQVSPGGLGIIR
jgi:hypothetical protein